MSLGLGVLAIVAGVGLGVLAPGLFEAVARCEWAGVDLVVAFANRTKSWFPASAVRA